MPLRHFNKPKIDKSVNRYNLGHRWDEGRLHQSVGLPIGSRSKRRTPQACDAGDARPGRRAVALSRQLRPYYISAGSHI